MDCFVIKKENYILAIGKGNHGERITEEYYNSVLDALENKPARTETTDYHLTEDLKWEPYQIEPQPDEPQTEDKAEAYDILMGVTE